MQQDTLIAGDTLNFLTAVPDYPATASWVLKYYLIPRTVGNAVITLTATAEGADHRVTVPASSTQSWAPDAYSWSARAEKGAEKYTIQDLRGQLTILQNPATAVAGYDGRSQAEKALADCRVAFAAWTPTTRRYRIGDREREFSSKSDIVGAIHYWQNELARERRAEALAKGLPDPRRTYVRVNRE